MTELPESWEVCTFADVTTPVEMVSSSNHDDQEIRYIDISSIDNRRNRIADPKTLRMSDAPSRARQIVKSGDVLFSTVRPYLRNIAAVPDHLDGQIASTGFAVLRAAPGVSPAYLFFKAISRDFVSALTGEQYGVSYPAVKEEQVRSQPFELPPTNEQHRIVAKIEALFSELDAGQDSLTRAQVQLKLYRQSLLKAAFQGRLTADWRKANPDKLENPETLLARIRSERDARYKQALDDWQTALTEWRTGGEVGRKPAKPKRPSEITVPDKDALETLPPLPESWVYIHLAHLGDLARGKSRHRPRNDPRLFGGPYPFIQTGEVKAAGRKISSYSVTYSEFGLSQSRLWPAGTLCITIAANIAETAFLDFEGCFPDSVVGFTEFENVVEPEFVECFIKAARVEIAAYAPATAQKNINLTTLEELVVPYCGPEEQRQISSRLDAAFSTIDAIETEITTALAKLSALRQSILKKAFSGQLVPQDPADEPAAALLSRLRNAAPTPRRKTKA